MTHHTDDFGAETAPTAVRDLLRQAAAPSSAEPSAALLTAMAAEARSSFGGTVTPLSGRSRVAKVVTAKVAAVAVAVTLSATGAAAANGSLPDAAQNGLAKAASYVGVSLPEAADDRARDALDELGPEGAGNDVSTVATERSSIGREKGATVSGTAGGEGVERSGAEGDRPAQTTGEPPVSTPNQGEAGTTDGNPASENAPVQTPNDGDAAEDPPDAPPAAPAGSPDRGAEHSDTASEHGQADARSAPPDAADRP